MQRASFVAVPRPQGHDGAAENEGEENAIPEENQYLIAEVACKTYGATNFWVLYQTLGFRDCDDSAGARGGAAVNRIRHRCQFEWHVLEICDAEYRPSSSKQ
jgi:hypothetical protein